MAAYAALLRPRTPASISIALLALGSAPWNALRAVSGGLGAAPGEIAEPLASWVHVANVLYFATGLGLLGLGFWIPARIDLKTRPPRIGLVMGLTGALAYLGLVLVLDGPGVLALAGGAKLAAMLAMASDLLVDGGFVLLILLLPARAADPRSSTAHVRALAILAFGNHLFAAGTAGAWVGESAISQPGTALTIIGILAASSAAWLMVTRADVRRIGVATALAISGLYATSTVVALAGGTYAYPLGSLLAVFVLGYAALSGQIPGIDAKVRLTISRSTVAAIFVAAFFVASEGAQQFFGDQFQSAYLGIAAAGLLVLAITPIQRLADRLADTAIPVRPSAAASGSGLPRHEAAYVEALRAALRDGTLTRREERHLARAADHLGIGATRALELREAVEKEPTDADPRAGRRARSLKHAPPPARPMRTQVSVDIQAPRDAVWNAVTDIANAAGRVKGIEKVEMLERPASGLVGTKWRETRTMYGKQATETMWITDAAEGRFYDARAESHGAIYETRVALEDAAGGTRVTMDFGATPVTFGAKVMTFLLGGLMKGSVRKALQKDLDDIKAALESAR